MAKRNIAIACQGGGSHAAYATGVLQRLLPRLNAQPDKLQLVGVSGTSGGAICALLAWYGLLQGGSSAAAHKLNEFWSDNCARLPGKRLSNAMNVAGLESLPYEIQGSSYEFPLKELHRFTVELWPAAARMTGLSEWWMRSDFFQLDALVSRHVDFGMIADLGGFCSIPLDIKRWLEADMQSEMFGQLDSRKTKLHLEERIRHHLTMPSTIRERMRGAEFASSGFFAADCPGVLPVDLTLILWPLYFKPPKPNKKTECIDLPYLKRRGLSWRFYNQRLRAVIEEVGHEGV